jgi:hypothetical protein
LKDQEKVEKFWREHLATRSEVLTRQQDAKVEIFDYKGALEKFGKPPKKFAHLKLKRCLFASVNFEQRHGYLLILEKSKKVGWQVTAVTD